MFDPKVSKELVEIHKTLPVGIATVKYPSTANSVDGDKQIITVYWPESLMALVPSYIDRHQLNQ